ncbi:MAG TPA: protease pro-enzyme activation domain-containing protein, partial [Blastocatellia bacterium]|nr:protease pro-enzyme activation domain-containing protein [Blastocatellia bacterium]
MKTAYFRAFLILIIGTILCASITFVASAGGGRARGTSVRQTASSGEVSGIKKRIGEIPAKAKTAPFLGYLAPNERIRMLLSFQLNDEAGLQQLISDLYNPDSPQYHQWLTPEQFGERYGRTNDEIDWVVKWLQQQGMDVDRTYANRLSVGFTGAVDAVQQAFQVQIATYFDVGNNKPFYSNTSAPTLPAEFEAFTVGLEGLSNAAVYHRPTRLAQAKTSAQAKAEATSRSSSGYQPQGKVGQFLFLLPQDLALLYDYAPLWNSNIKGAGQKVGIVIDSDVPNSDMTTYRTDAGLPAANLQRVLYPGFSNPGLTGGEDEADLDTQNVSAVAPAAEIDLVLIPQLDSGSILTVEQDI